MSEVLTEDLLAYVCDVLVCGSRARDIFRCVLRVTIPFVSHLGQIIGRHFLLELIVQICAI